MTPLATKIHLLLSLAALACGGDEAYRSEPDGAGDGGGAGDASVEGGAPPT